MERGICVSLSGLRQKRAPLARVSGAPESRIATGSTRPFPGAVHRAIPDGDPEVGQSQGLFQRLHALCVAAFTSRQLMEVYTGLYARTTPVVWFHVAPCSPSFGLGSTVWADNFESCPSVEGCCD